MGSTTSKLTEIFNNIFHNVHHWPYLRDIKIPTNNYGEIIFIDAGMPQLHLQGDTKTGETNDAIAVKTTLVGKIDFIKSIQMVQ